MTMKQLIIKLFIIFICSGSIAYAKVPADAEASLNKMLESYKTIALSGDVEKSLEFTYPKVFKQTPKEQLIEMLKEQEKSGAPRPKITTITQTPTLPIKEFSNGLYTSVDYEMDLTMSIAQPGKEKEMQELLKKPKELAAFQNFMKNMLAASLGEGANIEFEPNSFNAKIHKKSKFIAINEEKKGWKIVELAGPTVAIAESILPKEIFEAYKTDIDAIKKATEAQMKALMSSMMKN